MNQMTLQPRQRVRNLSPSGLGPRAGTDPEGCPLCSMDSFNLIYFLLNLICPARTADVFKAFLKLSTQVSIFRHIFKQAFYMD